MIFYGPPGTGKTTLARLLAGESRSQLRAAQRRDQRREGAARGAGRGPRPAVGRRPAGRCCSSTRSTASTRPSRTCCCPTSRTACVILVGATTQNPFFAVNSALVSRSRVFQFQPLSPDDIKTLLRRALADKERGLGEHDVRHARRRARVSGRGERRRRPPGAGGAGGRRALERRAAASSSRARWPRNRCSARRSSTTRTGDAHYDAASALIKSIRGSDPDAAHLLAGPDARSGRGRAVSRPAAGDPGQRGRRQRRSARPAAGRGRDAGLRVRRPARVPVAAGPGGDLPGLRAEVERRDGGASARPGATCAKAACCPCRSTCATSTTPARSGSATARATSTRTTPPDGVAAQDYLGVEREYYRPVPRGFEQELAERLETIRARLREGRKPAE